MVICCDKLVNIVNIRVLLNFHIFISYTNYNRLCEFYNLENVKMMS